MNNIAISNHPLFSDVTRDVELTGIDIRINNINGQAVILSLLVHYYQNGNNIDNVFPIKPINLIATNDTWVDIDGNIVPEGDISAVMTEYEFFMMMMNVPVVISDIVESKVAWADSLGRFN